MPLPLDQHQTEIRANLVRWQSKPLLRQLYADFYQRIVAALAPRVPGLVVEIGSGIGNLKQHVPSAICTDLFPNPWLDLVCDGYDLPFADDTVSHLVLFDVFHHLEVPRAFLREALRVLPRGGRLVLFEPYISWISHPVYGLLHHEPVALRQPISRAEIWPRPRRYYAAQGNATQCFFGRRADPAWQAGWRLEKAEAFACFSYLLSGGYSKPSAYPGCVLPWLEKLDGWLSRWPRCFAGRCLVVLVKV